MKNAHLMRNSIYKHRSFVLFDFFSVFPIFMAWHGMAWHGIAWHGMAWHGMAYGMYYIISV